MQNYIIEFVWDDSKTHMEVLSQIAMVQLCGDFQDVVFCIGCQVGSHVDGRGIVKRAQAIQYFCHLCDSWLGSEWYYC